MKILKLFPALLCALCLVLFYPSCVKNPLPEDGESVEQGEGGSGEDDEQGEDDDSGQGQDDDSGEGQGGESGGEEGEGGEGEGEEQGGVTVIDPGQTPSGQQTYTPQHPELQHNIAYCDFYNAYQDELDDYGNLDYVCAQGNGTAWPIVTVDKFIRLYQGSSASKGGSYIRFRSHNGATMQKITVGTATNTKVAWYFNGKPSTRSATVDFKPDGLSVTADSHSIADGRLSVNCPSACTEVCFICMGTSQSERWEMNYIEIDYTGGFVEDDFKQTAVEYGPLVKVDYPFKEDFEIGFPTTDKPTYYKYGLTAGRENLQWNTWFGSFSWQKPSNKKIQDQIDNTFRTQSAQLRVYQEDSEYEKEQFGHLRMEFFLKDLRKVTFKYYFVEYWSKVIVSYCEFGTTQHKNPQTISLPSYSDRETIREFEYVLDGGSPHDAKIIIEIDPATGHPSKDHYDFYFDQFVFE